INIPDGRLISKTQRKKAYAIMGDISDWAGYGPEEIKELMKFLFEFETGHEYFSFASVDMTTAREFITFLLDLALKEHIQLKKTGLDYQDDLDAYMHQSLKYRSCVLCGRHADVHHIDAIGMGNDRRKVDHRGRLLIALCREHHQLAHQMGWLTFKDQYHVKGVTLDAETLNRLGIMTYKRMKEIDDEQSST
ncbi:putative HNHc nuclease, partial [Weissella diestrammenae]